MSREVVQVVGGSQQALSTGPRHKQQHIASAMGLAFSKHSVLMHSTHHNAHRTTTTTPIWGWSCTAMGRASRYTPLLPSLPPFLSVSTFSFTRPIPLCPPNQSSLPPSLPPSLQALNMLGHASVMEPRNPQARFQRANVLMKLERCGPPSLPPSRLLSFLNALLFPCLPPSLPPPATRRPVRSWRKSATTLQGKPASITFSARYVPSLPSFLPSSSLA